MKIAPEGSWVQNEHVASVIGEVIVNRMAVLLLLLLLFFAYSRLFRWKTSCFRIPGRLTQKQKLKKIKLNGSNEYRLLCSLLCRNSHPIGWCQLILESLCPQASVGSVVGSTWFFPCHPRGENNCILGCRFQILKHAFTLPFRPCPPSRTLPQ